MHFISTWSTTTNTAFSPRKDEANCGTGVALPPRGAWISSSWRWGRMASTPEPPNNNEGPLLAGSRLSVFQVPHNVLYINSRTLVETQHLRPRSALTMGEPPASMEARGEEAGTPGPGHSANMGMTEPDSSRSAHPDYDLTRPFSNQGSLCSNLPSYSDTHFSLFLLQDIHQGPGLHLGLPQQAHRQYHQHVLHLQPLPRPGAATYQGYQEGCPPR